MHGWMYVCMSVKDYIICYILIDGVIVIFVIVCRMLLFHIVPSYCPILEVS